MKMEEPNALMVQDSHKKGGNGATRPAVKNWVKTRAMVASHPPLDADSPYARGSPLIRGGGHQLKDLREPLLIEDCRW